MIVLSLVVFFVGWLYRSWPWIASQINALEIQLLSGLLIGVATVIAGVLALLISVSLFVIQNAADNYTPTILNQFARDKVSIILYFFIGVSSLFVFLSSLFLKSQPYYVPGLVVFSMVLLAITFALAYWQYSRMANIVNPVRLLENWQKICLTHIRTVDRNMNEVVEFLKQKNVSTSGVRPDDYAGLSKAGFYLREQSIHASLEKKLRQVYSITKRAAIKRDYEVIETGLAVISNVLRSYLIARQDSTVPLPTSIPLSFSVDYDSLFDRSFQELQEICRIATSNSDENLIRRIVDTIAAIGIQSVEIVPKGDFVRNNPVTGLSILYVVGITEEASRHGYTDVCLSAVAGIKAIVQRALAKKVPLVFEEALKPLNKIALLGLVHRKSYVFDRVMEVLSTTSHQVVEIDHFDAEEVVRTCLEEAKKLILLAIPLIEESGLQGTFEVTNYIRSLLDLSQQTAIPYITRILPPRFRGKSYDDRDAMRAFHNFVGLNKLFYAFYREFGEQFGKTESFMLFYVHEAIRENVSTILTVLQDKTWTFERAELENRISWLLSFYWVTFDAHQQIKKNFYHGMSDFLGWLGILSVKNIWFDVADSCIQDISSIANQYLQKGDGFQYEAPRIFMNNVYILMIANKKKYGKIKDQALKELTNFHSSYTSKLSNLDPSGKFLQEFKTRLLIELQELRREFDNGPRHRTMLDGAESTLFLEIQESDFDEVEIIVRGVVDPPVVA